MNSGTNSQYACLPVVTSVSSSYSQVTVYKSHLSMVATWSWLLGGRFRQVSLYNYFHCVHVMSSYLRSLRRDCNLVKFPQRVLDVELERCSDDQEDDSTIT